MTREKGDKHFSSGRNPLTEKRVMFQSRIVDVGAQNWEEVLEEAFEARCERATQDTKVRVVCLLRKKKQGIIDIFQAKETRKREMLNARPGSCLSGAKKNISQKI